jgi:hypothetical protein
MDRVGGIGGVNEIRGKNKSKIKGKSSGQECPLHTSWRLLEFPSHDLSQR